MAYTGKFVDRSPIICPAGLVSADENKLVKCLNNYPVKDHIDALKNEAGIIETPSIEYKRQKMENTRHKGIYSNVKDLTPKLETRFQTLINDLKDSTLDSFWNKQLGRGRDPTGNLPAGFDAANTTFGTPTKRDCTMKEILCPKASGIYEVLYDSQEAHDWYTKTHNDYNPGELVNRNYCKTFDPNKKYGQHGKPVQKGKWAKCCLTWKNEQPITSVNSVQADYIKRSKYDLGKCLTPNHNINCVPKGHRFGKLSKRELHGIPELLMDFDCPPSIFKRDYYDWISHLNELRSHIKRTNKDLKELAKQCLYHDTVIILFLDYPKELFKHGDLENYNRYKEQSGWLPFDTMYKVFNYRMLTFNHSYIKPLAEYLGLLQEEFIRYQEFINLLDVNKEMPDFGKFQDIPNKHVYFVTTNMDARCDFLTIDHSGMAPAGIPGIRFDLPRPVVGPGCIKADLESLGEETSSGGVINPSIYSNYGITHMDLFMPRKPELIRRLFENIDYKFPGDTFERIWNIGVQLDKTGLVCVDTFKKLMDKAAPLHRLEEKTDSC